MSDPATSRGGSASRYQQAGVDIDLADQSKQTIGQRIASTYGPRVVGGFGHFGSMFRVPASNKDQVLVSSADSVGTKVLVAALANDHRGIGVDLVNHCLNDILACGASPLYFLDYFAAPELDPHILDQLITGMASACEEAECSLIGGETAQLPGIYQSGTYDLAGFIVGSVLESHIIDGSTITAGDSVIGLPSNGLHTNGFSLARAALDLNGSPEDVREKLSGNVPELGSTLGKALLTPHRSYLWDVQPHLSSGSIHGMAHITGGGINGNLSRVIPDGLSARIDRSAWSVPPLFQLIQHHGDISDSEMFNVFNMGIGYILVTDSSSTSSIIRSIPGSTSIGEIQTAATGTPAVTLSGLSGA